MGPPRLFTKQASLESSLKLSETVEFFELPVHICSTEKKLENLQVKKL